MPHKPLHHNLNINHARNLLHQNRKYSHSPIITAINREIKPYASNLFNLLINKLELSSHSKNTSLVILDISKICKEVDKIYPIALSNVIWME